MTATQQPAPPLSPDISVKPIRKLPGRRKPLLVELWQTGVGKKWVMGVTGVVLMLFIFGHAIGNLKMYIGPEDFDHYSEFLRELLVPILPRTVTLWLIRIGLIAAFAGHILAAASLTAQNRKANVPYQSRRDYLAANFAARTMRWTGVIILLFLIFHLADLTWGLEPIATDQWTRGLAYENVTESLQRVGVAVFYVLANLALGIHLFHGSWSLFQSLGFNNPRFNSARRYFATGFAALITVINVSFPIMILAGVVGDSRDETMTIPPDPKLVSGVPTGPIEKSWDQHKFDMKLVNPGNKRKFEVIVVGTGLAGASAAASMAQLGYEVKVFTFHDSPRRAHSIAAQGGINAAKNYPNDGDSIYRLFYDTVKGGDFRAREANVYRLAQVSVDIIDQCVAQGVPFAREYGGLLDNRSFGGAQVSRTFYARGQTGQQLLLGAYQALEQQVSLGNVRMFTKTEMLDVVVKDGKACGIVVRDLVSGEISSHSGHAVVLATGGYSNVYYLSTNAMNCNVTAAWRAHKKGAMFANPCFTQIHPTCIPSSDEFQSKLTLMSESLRNDGRIWVPKNPDETRSPDQIPDEDRDYFLERKYPAFGNLVPRDVASRNAKTMVDTGYGVGPLKNSVYLDFAGAIDRLGESVIRERYGNLFDMYERITDENPYKVPMRIYPAIHYTMGGLWVDYNLMTTVPGLYAIGEANFADQGANRLGASALMQGLADGYFVLPYTIGDYLSGLLNQPTVPTDDPEFASAEAALRAEIDRWLSVGGTKSVDYYHRELGKIMWDRCGMARDRAGLEKALAEIPALREEFEKDVRVLGSAETVNQSLEKVQRVADFFELAELMCRDALMRQESCGGHFRVEHQTPEGEAERDDEHFAFVAAWDWQGKGTPQDLHREPLEFDYVHLTQRSYK